ncbi:hypothetical protein AX15_003764 [Amanita polypyramis BW_CC]|nr:hypothetical protein AX15_003764 [Amanita polypyramis BW_CC]
MPISLVLSSLTAAAAVSAIIVVLLRHRKQQATYPPGPSPKLIIGNALDVPLKKSWIKYFDWSKKYNSDIIHLSVMGTHIFVLHKMKDVIALLEKRSAIYSGRPSLPVFKLLEVENLTAVMDYGHDWRKHRKLFKEGLRKNLMPSYMRTQTGKVHLLLHLLLNDPEGFMEHCKWLSVAHIMSMAYDYDVVPGQEGEGFVKLAEESVNSFSNLFLPSSTLINVLPFLRHVPPWVPGASTQKMAVKATGKYKECILGDLLQHRTKVDGAYEDEDILKNVTATTYIAGVETVSIAKFDPLNWSHWQIKTALLNLFFTIVYNPSAQKKAQEEIDRFVGTERLPNFEDRSSLPYVEALVRETLRWRVIAPYGAPHTTTDDDTYNEFYASSIVMANVWAITRDEAVYPDPELFKPERFFSSDGTLNDDTMEYAFGFGRRICPGQPIADTLLWLVTATVLSTFNISKAKDKNGIEVELDLDAFTSSASTMKMFFCCSSSVQMRGVKADGGLIGLVEKEPSQSSPLVVKYLRTKERLVVGVKPADVRTLESVDSRA